MNVAIWRAVEGHPPTTRPVNLGSQLLKEVYEFLGRFVAYPSEAARVAHTLWVAHSHCMSSWESTPRLAFLSPEPGSGKTRALEITGTLVPRPVEAVSASPAYLFRKVSDPEGAPTILHDEIDTVFGPKSGDHEDVRAFLNAGHRKGAKAGRCVIRGKEICTEEFPAYCAVALAGLGNLPDTILTRAVVIRMRRRAPGEKVEPYRQRLHAKEGHRIRDELAMWAQHITPFLVDVWPTMPEGIEDRNADVWESLLAIADEAGGEWPEKARAAAVALVAQSQDNSPSLGVRLLADLRKVFGDRDTMPTEEIIRSLCALDEAPWSDLRGKALDPRKLAGMLKPYNVMPRVLRVGNSTPRGYVREDLWDAWVRYLPALHPKSATSATPETMPHTSRYSVADDVAGVVQRPPQDAGVADAVAHQTANPQHENTCNSSDVSPVVDVAHFRCMRCADTGCVHCEAVS